jgi:hypothetical protein
VSRYHHGRDDVPRDAQERAAHEETDAPAEMVERLLAEISRIAYTGRSVERWMQDQRPLMEALTWPAVWLNQRGVGMPVADYEAKMREIIVTIERHGAVAQIKFFPAYLLDCIRKHFLHQGDEIYAARKHVRTVLDMSFLKGKAPQPVAVDAVQTLAKVHAVLSAGRRAKTRKEDDSQGSLF